MFELSQISVLSDLHDPTVLTIAGIVVELGD
jgi:hypothetical protein